MYQEEWLPGPQIVHYLLADVSVHVTSGTKLIAVSGVLSANMSSSNILVSNPFRLASAIVSAGKLNIMTVRVFGSKCVTDYWDMGYICPFEYDLVVYHTSTCSW